MAKWLRQSTASQEVLLGPFVDDTDGKTAETGLTIANTDIKVWKEGATSEANKNSGGATHIASGRYYAVLDATDTNTLGQLEINVAVAGALPVRREFMVVPAMIFDALILGTDRFDTNVTHIADTAQTARDIGASVLLSPGTGTGQISLTSGAVTFGNTSIATVTTATNVTNGVTLASGAVTAASIASDAITAAKIADEASVEIADAVWVHMYGQLVLGDAAGAATAAASAQAAAEAASASTTTLLSRLTSGRATNLDNLDAAITSRMATFTLPTNFSTLGINASGHISRVVLTDTITTYTGNTPQTGDSYARIGAAGASLTAVPWNAAWDAEAQSEATDALNAYDPPTMAELTARSLATADYATAAALTTVDDFLDTEIAAIKAKTDALPSDPADASDITAAFGTVNTTLGTIAGYIDTEISALTTAVATVDTVVDAILVDTADIQPKIGTPAVTLADDIAGVSSGGSGLDAAGVRAAVGLATANLDTQLATIDTVADAIKVKTDALPTDPADASDITSAFATVNASLATLTAYVDTEVAAIKAKTDNLPSDPADASDIATALATLSTYVDTEVAAIKAKTDTLPTDPADASDITAAFSTVNASLTTLAAYVDTEVAAIKAKTDNLPASPAATGDVTSATTTITAAIPSAATNASAVRTNLATELNTITTNLDAKVSEVEGGGGGSGTGNGDIAVNHDTGGTDALRFTTSGGVGIDNARIIAYLAADYDAGTRSVVAQTYTGTDGRWIEDLHLDADTYRIVFSANGYETASTEIEVA